MKKIKLFPTPHVEIRLHVSEEMERDFWRCKAMRKPGEELSGVGCSWEDVCIGAMGACEMKELEEQMGGISGETDGKER